MLLYKHFGGFAALYADYNTCCGTLEAYTLEIVVLYCTFGFAYSHIFYAGTDGAPYFGFHIHSKLLVVIPAIAAIYFSLNTEAGIIGKTTLLDIGIACKSHNTIFKCSVVEFLTDLCNHFSRCLTCIDYSPAESIVAIHLADAER